MPFNPYSTPPFFPDGDTRRRIRPRLSGPPALPELPMTPPTFPMPPAGNPASTIMRNRQTPQSRAGEYGEAKDVYLKGTPGRTKSGLMGALQGGLAGLATGGLGGAVGGAVGGALGGAVNPRGLREQRFNREVAPEILGRFALEDDERAARIAEVRAIAEQNRQQQDSEMNAARIRNIESEIQARDRGPRPSFIETPAGVFDPESRAIIPGTAPQPKEPAKPGPSPKLGRNLRTGRITYYDANDPAQNAEHTPYQMPRQPRAVGAAKPKKEPQYVSIDKVRQFAEKQGISVSEAKARAKQDGFTVVQ